MEIPCVHRLEDVILLKCSYYPKQLMNPMQSLSGIPRAFFFAEIEKKNSQTDEFQRTSNISNDHEKEK